MPRALRRRLVRRLGRRLVAQRRDLVSCAGEHRGEPRALGPAAATGARAPRRTPRGSRRRPPVLVRLGGLAGRSTPGSASSASARGGGLPGMRACSPRRERQHLFQGRRDRRQPRLLLAPHVRLAVTLPRLSTFAGRLAQRGLQRVAAGRQAEAQVEAAAVDAAQFPDPGHASALALRAGETGHGGEGGGHRRPCVGGRVRSSSRPASDCEPAICRAMERFAAVLVTGASSGIGRAMALACARPGAVLHLSGRDPARLEDDRAGCRARGADGARGGAGCARRRRHGSLDRGGGAARSRGRQCRHLGRHRRRRAGDPAQARAIFATNLDGVLNTALPAMEVMAAPAARRGRPRGRIAVIASIAAFVAAPGAPAYCASKAAVDAWAVATAPSARAARHRLTSICPGYVRTPMTAGNRFPMPGLMDADRARAHRAGGDRRGPGARGVPLVDGRRRPPGRPAARRGVVRVPCQAGRQGCRRLAVVNPVNWRMDQPCRQLPARCGPRWCEGSARPAS